MPEKVGDAVLVLRTDNTQLVAGLDAAQKATQRLGQKMTQAGRALTTSVTLPIIGVGVAATKMVADFEESMSKIVGLVGVSRDQVDAWSEQILRLAPQLGKAPSELADALFFVTSAGIRGADAMNVLTMAAKASSAGLGDMTAVADALTSAMNAYGPANLSAAEATDVLVATVREGKLEADQLAGSIGRVIPVASAMGVQFKEVGALMASMTRIGFTTDEAATALTATMSALLKPTKEAEDAFAALGTSSSELRTQVREEGLLSVLDRLQQSVHGDTAAMADMFPNVRALRGVLGLLGGNAENTAQIMEALSDNTGDTDAAFQEAQSTLKFKLNSAIGEFKTALTEIGQVIGPVVVPILQQLVDFVHRLTTWFKNLSPETQRFLLIAAGVAAALGPALLIFGQITKAVGTMSSVLKLAGNPYVLLAIAAGIAAYLIIKNWDTVSAATQRFANNVADIFKGIAKIISSIFKGIYEDVKYWLVDKVNDVSAWLQVAWAKITNAYVKAHNVIVDIFGGEKIPPVDVSALENQLKTLDQERQAQHDKIKSDLQAQTKLGAQMVSAGARDIGAQAAEIGQGVADIAVNAYNKVAGILGDVFKGGGPVAGLLKETETQTEETTAVVVAKTKETADVVYDLTDAEIANINQEVDAAVDHYQTQQDAFAAMNEEMRRISDERRAEEERAEEEHAQAISRLRGGLFQYTAQIASSLGSIWNSYYAGLLQNEDLTDAQRKELLKKQASSQKAFAIFNAILSTAQAIIGFLANPGGFVGIGLSILAGISGAAQIAAIVAQPIPSFAGGGNFTVPPGYENDTFPMMVSSGEQVDVRTPEQAAASIPLRVMVALDGSVILNYLTEATRNRELVLHAGAVR